MAKKKPAMLLPTDRIERAILIVRKMRVMLDEDLAALYGVETKALVQAVKRNLERFPADFMFQLTKNEFADLKSWDAGKETADFEPDLRSQTVTSRWGGRRYAPYAFTEQGVAMLSSVLRSQRAVEVNVEIMRAFVRLRELLATHKDLAAKLVELEQKYDEKFRVVFQAIRQLMEPPPGKPKGRIGYQ